VRLSKFIADAGICSRRKAEAEMLRNMIKVNGVTVTELGLNVDPRRDRVEYGGTRVFLERSKIYIMLHKPVGYVTTVKDELGRPTVMDLIADVKTRVTPVGRLDYNTSGLLILTNDGDLTYKLTHPKHETKKTYHVIIEGAISKTSLNAIRDGVMIDGRVTAPAAADVINERDKTSMLKITIHEGRNRQIRKMFDALGYKVTSLKRVGTGSLELGTLPQGKYRRLTRDEVSSLYAIQGSEGLT
jgi:23S rRNA pseudouridine2605 synthase